MLQTDRLILRRWRASDHKAVAAICADRDVMRFIGNGETQAPQRAVDMIAHFEAEWEKRGYGLFALELRTTGDHVVFCGLAYPDFLPEILPSIEIGWRLKKSAWGRGYALEAARAALGFGIRDRGLDDIVSICQIPNMASERIMKKLGMTFDRETIDPSCDRAVRVYRLPINGPNV